MLDDECEDETLDKFTHTYISDDEGAASDSELDTEEEDDSYCKENNHIEKNSENQINEPLEKSHLQMNSCSVSTGTIRKKPKKVISTEAFQASVAEREALAAAANLTLLPDEPPNRLINVVGQALRHGKTVVYEVMRTAARQPDGELIPVGGLGTTASSTNLTTLQTNSQIDGALKNHQEGKRCSIFLSVIFHPSVQSSLNYTFKLYECYKSMRLRDCLGKTKSNDEVWYIIYLVPPYTNVNVFK